MTSFSVVSRSFAPNRGETDHVFLERYTWDDYGFKTLFQATYSTFSGELVKLGQLKIIKKGMPSGFLQIGLSFQFLGDEYCSLGQDQSFYETVRALPAGVGFKILELLRDIVWLPDIAISFINDEAFNKSLMRGVDFETIGIFRQFLLGVHQQTEYHFAYISGDEARHTEFDFVVEPASLPPTNVHVLIGRNGVGKTTLLGRMAESVCLSEAARAGRKELGQFLHHSASAKPTAGFANVLSVSFSAFDDFPIPSGDGKDLLDTRYEYIGLRSFAHNRLKTLAELTKEFSESVELCIRSSRFPFWKKAIETLSSDPGFESLRLSALSQIAGDVADGAWEEIYHKASAGHRLVLLTIAKLVESVGERTLVLFDEPEAHLHPPLLGSFVRALSELLLARNGVAIMATHSPVVLQELPARCVLILTREGNSLRAVRPSLETFGEALGILTHEVFGLEVRRSGHHALISSLIKKLGPNVSYGDIEELFGGRLGTEASSIVLALLSTNGD